MYLADEAEMWLILPILEVSFGLARDGNSKLKYTNNSAEMSHQPTRMKERIMRRSDVSEFKSMKQAQRL
jgi:transposase-like protein